ncbi:MAG: pseudaminic acid biosynthesis-associated methylase, partial [Rhodospirillales bacterium]|nr:pseudaminic acid biosynthesis-associated methylase [Rhodospirillales bacterium]
EIMQRYSDLQLVDYGFVYHGDKFLQDDVTWFLMEKRGT